MSRKLETFLEKFVARWSAEVLQRLELVPQERPNMYRLSWGKAKISQEFELDPAMGHVDMIRILAAQVERFMGYE